MVVMSYKISLMSRKLGTFTAIIAVVDGYPKLHKWKTVAENSHKIIQTAIHKLRRFGFARKIPFVYVNILQFDMHSGYYYFLQSSSSVVNKVLGNILPEWIPMGIVSRR
uniref:Uncharacterized protein n=1 Tax=Photinus pyralis TaxID=7054 RepID=A0A1Y1MYP1_PHOPY